MFKQLFWMFKGLFDMFKKIFVRQIISVAECSGKNERKNERVRSTSEMLRSAERSAFFRYSSVCHIVTALYVISHASALGRVGRKLKYSHTLQDYWKGVSNRSAPTPFIKFIYEYSPNNFWTYQTMFKQLFIKFK